LQQQEEQSTSLRLEALQAELKRSQVEATALRDLLSQAQQQSQS